MRAELPFPVGLYPASVMLWAVSTVFSADVALCGYLRLKMALFLKIYSYMPVMSNILIFSVCSYASTFMWFYRGPSPKIHAQQ